MFTCAECALKGCRTKQEDKMPSNCPCKKFTEEEMLSLYSEIEREESVCSAQVESEGYSRLTRVEETMIYAHKMGYKKIGVAFCVGLRQEAKIFTNILRKNGFETESVVCKCVSIDKTKIGLQEDKKIKPGNFEPMCNPVGQAKLLEIADTDFNVVIGLCVGHDTMFLRHSKAPVTVMVVKDRVLAHNPVGALYANYHYYSKKLDNTIENYKKQTEK